ncbi:MAG: hypothetical protein HOQ03_06130 [Thermoleophilia bacterium]|nr:hypothetical protein [Thermoleophilia bacterium]
MRGAAAAAVLMLVLALPAPAAPGPKRASIGLESTAPLVVTGRFFGARESVRLTFAGADRTRRALTVRARADGSFRARFALELDPCAVFTVRAVGARGSRAVLQVNPACEPKRKGPPKRRAPAIPEPPGD